MRSILLSACLGWAAGAVLLDAAPAFAEDLVYVTNYRSDTLSIFPIEGESAAATLALASNAGAAPVQQIPGANPRGAVAGLAVGGPVALELSPDGRLAWIVETGPPGALLIVDTGERRVLATVPLEAEPFALAVSAQGEEMYVANFGSDTVSVVDTGARRVVTTIGVGHGPGGVALTRERAYVANTGANTVSVIDRGARKVVGEIQVGKAPLGVAISRESLFVAESGAGSVSVIRTEDDRVVATIPVGRAPVTVVVSPDTQRAFVSNQADNSVSVIDTRTNRVTATIPVGREPSGLALTRGGDRLAVANRSGNTVSIVDTRTHEVLRTVPVGTAPFGLAIGARANGGACHCTIRPVRTRSAWAAAAFVVPLLLRRAWSRGRPGRRPQSR